MIEVITKDKDGREMCREVKEGETLKLYGDEVEIQVFIVKRKKVKKSSAIV